MHARLHVRDGQRHVPVGGNRQVGEIADALDAEGHVEGPGGGDGLAHVQRLDLRQGLGVAFDGVREAVQQDRPLPRRHLGPRWESLGRRVNRPVQVVAFAFGHGRQDRAVRGVDHAVRAALRAGLPLPTV